MKIDWSRIPGEQAIASLEGAGSYLDSRYRSKTPDLNEKRDLVTRIQEALSRIDRKTSAGVAKAIQERGFVGLRGDPCRGPLILYLYDAVPGLDACVSLTSVSYMDRGEVKRLTLPAMISQFETEFSRGAYPELDYWTGKMAAL